MPLEKVSIEKLSLGAWRCLKLTDGHLEAVVSTDIGPRILRFGAVGGRNLLHEVASQQGLSGGAIWRPYGGHRLWHAPEEKPRTYAPDNASVEADCDDHAIRLTQATEPSTGIQKQLELRLEGGCLRVVHRLTNRNPWAVELAPLVSHRFPLHRVAEAFALNAEYRDGVVKVIIDV